MANQRSGNTVFVDSTGDVVDKTIRVLGILFTPETSPASATLRDKTPGRNIKLKFEDRVSSDRSHLYSFKEFPLLFQDGIEVSAITGCSLTLILSEGS